MARIQGKDIFLEDNDQIYFGDNVEAALWYESGDLRLNHTISGADAVASYHLVTKNYVDQVVGIQAGYPVYYIEKGIHIQVPNWGQYVIHDFGYLEIDGTLELGEGGMIIIQGVN